MFSEFSDTRVGAVRTVIPVTDPANSGWLAAAGKAGRSGQPAPVSEPIPFAELMLSESYCGGSESCLLMLVASMVLSLLQSASIRTTNPQGSPDDTFRVFARRII